MPCLYELNPALYVRKIPCLYTVLYVEQALLAIGTYHLAKPTGSKHWMNQVHHFGAVVTRH